MFQDRITYSYIKRIVFKLQVMNIIVIIDVIGIVEQVNADPVRSVFGPSHSYLQAFFVCILFNDLLE